MIAHPDTMNPAALPNGQLGTLPIPWAAGPFRLVSLLDMLRICAEDFISLLTILDRIANRVDEVPKAFAQLGRDMNNPDVHGGACLGLWDTLKPLMDDVEAASGRLELKLSLRKAQRIREQYAGNRFNFSTFQADLKTLREFIHAELKDRLLFFVPSGRAKFFEKMAIFGEKVQDKLPALSRDIESASRAIGVGLPTAAVFHLMRVAEYGLRRLAKRLKVPKNKIRHKTWGKMLEAINSAIVALTAPGSPPLTERQRKLRDHAAEAAAHLNNVKIGWRDSVSHCERDYTQEEAERIFENVKVFTDFLADKVF
jgi:hypothetical protein